MRGYQIAILISIAIFAAGILLSIFFNSFFLFLFLPIGIGWGFWRGGGRQQRDGQQEAQYSPSSQYCSYCGAQIRKDTLFCPNCGKAVPDNIHSKDLR